MPAILGFHVGAPKWEALALCRPGVVDTAPGVAPKDAVVVGMLLQTELPHATSVDAAAVVGLYLRLGYVEMRREPRYILAREGDEPRLEATAPLTSSAVEAQAVRVERGRCCVCLVQQSGASGGAAEGMGRAGFEPAKAVPTDLQSAPFDHSGISPETRAAWQQCHWRPPTQAPWRRRTRYPAEEAF